MKQYVDIGLGLGIAKMGIEAVPFRTEVLFMRAKNVAIWALLAVTSCSAEVVLGDRADAGTPSGGAGTSVADDRVDAAGQPGLCGDGILQSREQCDDGNTVGGDGCSATCATESGWSCVGAGTCTPKAACGNGQVENGEECDEGHANGASNSSCSAYCRIVRCGDGKIGPNEDCDDGNVEDGDGCSARCLLEAGWTCARGSACVRAGASCGDGIIDGRIGEECDDANENGSPDSWCTADCRISICGDGRIAANERCDDANLQDGDGCSARCQIEVGWSCPVPGTPCIRSNTQCGDSVIQAGEECDDGKNDGTYGRCGPNCQIGPHCGDGVVQADYEQCDDGRNDGGYSQCSPGCVLGPYCGDGVHQPDEECDDGNSVNGDGCSAGCVVEAGWACPAPGQACRKAAH